MRLRRFLAALGAAAMSAGAVFSTSAQAVEAGYDATIEPWTVKIVSDAGALCTGSVISSRWVITAAHCVGDHSSGKISVGAAADRSYHYSDSVKHPDGADVALVKLDQGIAVPAISIPAPGTFTHQPGFFSGWGMGRYPLQQGIAEVEGYYTDHARGGTQMFVTRSIIGNQEAGDSGGPFHVGPVLFGVLSSTGAKNEGGHIGANYTAVGPLVPWIYQTVPALSSSLPS